MGGFKMRLTKAGIRKIDELLLNPKVDNYHKTLLKAIKSRPKNISKSDMDITTLLLNSINPK